MPFPRRCSAHAARRSNSPGSLPLPRRAPSSAPSSPRKRRRPRKGYAERVDRRHGSLASSHGRYKKPAALVSGRWRSPPAHQDRQNSQRVETLLAGERGGALPRCRAGGANHLGGTRCASSEWARPATVVRWVTSPQESFTPHAHACSREGERGPRREPRAEEDSRLAGVPARRTCVAEIGSAVASPEKPV